MHKLNKLSYFVLLIVVFLTNTFITTSAINAVAQEQTCFDEVVNTKFVCSSFDYIDQQSGILAINDRDSSSNSFLFELFSISEIYTATYKSGVVNNYGNQLLIIRDPCLPASAVYKMFSSTGSTLIERNVTILNADKNQTTAELCDIQTSSSPDQIGDIKLELLLRAIEPATQEYSFGIFAIELRDPSNNVIENTFTTEIKIPANADSGSAVGNFVDIPYGSYQVCVVVPATVDPSLALSDECRDITLNTNVETITITYTDVDVLAAIAVDPTTIGADETDPQQVNCISKSVNPFGWMLCAMIEGLDSAVQAMYKVVQGELALFTDAEDGRIIDLDAKVKPLWEAFRNLSRSLLVIALMVIIYSQIVGTGVFEAYNVKKMLPKLALAVVGIELSWLLFSEFAVLVEDVSRGIPDLLLGVLGNPELSLQINNTIANTAAGVGIFSLMSIGAPSLLLGIIPIALGIFFAILTAFFVLIVRRMVLITLLILAPVALVLWVIPGTEKIFSKWFQTYQNLLFMYPLIQLLVVAGVLLSQIGPDITFEDATTVEETIGFIASVIAYFAPYFMIPYAFKWAGGAFASLAGMANNPSKGLLDRTRNKVGQRQKDMGERRKNLAIKNIDPNSSSFRSKLSNANNRIKSGRILSEKALGEFGRTSRMKEDLAAGEYAFKNKPEILDAQKRSQPFKLAAVEQSEETKAAEYETEELVSGWKKNFLDKPVAGFENERDYASHMLEQTLNDASANSATRVVAAKRLLTTDKGKSGPDAVRSLLNNGAVDQKLKDTISATNGGTISEKFGDMFGFDITAMGHQQYVTQDISTHTAKIEKISSISDPAEKTAAFNDYISKLKTVRQGSEGNKMNDDVIAKILKQVGDKGHVIDSTTVREIVTAKPVSATSAAGTVVMAAPTPPAAPGTVVTPSAPPTPGPSEVLIDHTTPVTAEDHPVKGDGRPT